MDSLSCSSLPSLSISSGLSPRFVRFAVSGTNTWCDKHTKDKRRIVCACMAPPRNLENDRFPVTKLSELSKSKNGKRIWGTKDDSDVLIECRDVYKSFGEKHILRGVSFKIRHGEAVGVIGPSGTGKSTILKIMAGLLAPDKGDVYIRGRKRA